MIEMKEETNYLQTGKWKFHPNQGCIIQMDSTFKLSQEGLTALYEPNEHRCGNVPQTRPALYIFSICPSHVSEGRGGAAILCRKSPAPRPER